jgi:glutamate dehydrogenase
MTLYDELLASELPDDPYLLRDLLKYFPRPLRARFRPQIEQHRLRREIIATLVANSLVNRGFGEYVGELGERTGRTSAAIARAYIIARDAFGLVPLLGQLELLTGRIGAARQSAIFGAVRQTAARGTERFLRSLAGPVDIAATVDRFAAGIADLLARIDTVLSDAERQALAHTADQYLGQGMPPDLAGRCAALPYLSMACEVVEVAATVGSDVAAAGSVYFAIDAGLQLARLRDRIERTSPRSQWERSALAGLYEDLMAQHRRLTIEAFASGRMRPGSGEADLRVGERVAAWLNSAVAGLARWQRLLAELERQPGADLAMLSVAVRSLSGLYGSEVVRAA